MKKSTSTHNTMSSLFMAYLNRPSDTCFAGDNLIIRCAGKLSYRSRQVGLTLFLASLLFLTGRMCAQNTLLVYEDFQSTPLGTIPGNFSVSGNDSSTLIEVTDAFGSYLHNERALRLEDRNITSITYVTVTSNTPPLASLAEGWMRLCFVPIDNGSTYVSPRLFFELRGAQNQTAVYFQAHGSKLYYYDNGTTPVLLEQSLEVNEVNNLLVWFDMHSKLVHGELNGAPLSKASNPGEPMVIDPSLPAEIVDLQLRVGDAATDKEVALIKLVELGEGPGPEASHTDTSGVIQVQVAPRTLPPGQPSYDEAPASVDIHFPSLLSMAGFQGKVKLSSLSVTASGSVNNELPCRWYDQGALLDFPVSVRALSADPEGELLLETGHNFGGIYPVFGESGIGRLVWMHTQSGNSSSQYDIHFEVETEGSESNEPGPLNWVGDGSARFEQSTSSTSGTSHVRVAVRDWDGDGKVDIIYGEQYGLIFFMKNTGTNSEPLFVKQDYVKMDDGYPISIGFAAAPVITDWNGDGIEDLLVGTHYNRIAYFKNTGSNTNRKFAYEGILRVDGEPLQLPSGPNGGNVGSTYSKDYYPVLEVVDWDDDGDNDLLAGGYVTGRIYIFHNIGTNADNTPILEFTDDVSHRVKLRDSSGVVLSDVGDWCAAPAVADVNGDGNNDLITGLWDRTSPKGLLLRLFINQGTNADPDLVETAFPKLGAYPSGALSSPRLVDMTDDGLLDLVLSTGKNIYFLKNIGTTTDPLWEGSIRPIKTPWANSPVSVIQLLSVNDDSLPDIYSANKTRLNTGAENPYAFAAGVSIFSSSAITHPSVPVTFPDGIQHPGGSVANTQNKLLDLDNDGKLDFVYADWHGQVWFHRNIGTSGPPYTFAEGVKCVRQDNSVIDVDLTHAHGYVKVEGGGRVVFTVADFDNDGKNDLVLGDTFGNVRFFRGAYISSAGVPKYYPEVYLRPQINPATDYIPENMRAVDATDWNQDGWLDVIVGSNKYDSVTVYLKKPDDEGFASGYKPTLPAITQPAPIMTDLNGDGGPEDMFIPGTQGSIWLERSFIDSGYAEGEVLSLTH